MNREQATFGESQSFEQKIVHVTGRIRKAHTQVFAIVLHQRRYLMRRWWMVLANAHIYRAPATSPIRNEIARDLEMKVQDKFGSERMGIKSSRGKGLLNAQNTLRQKRGQLSVGQDSSCGFEVAGSPA